MDKKFLEEMKGIVILVMQIAALLGLATGNYGPSLIVLLFIISNLMLEIISHLKMIRRIKTLNYREKHFDY